MIKDVYLIQLRYESYKGALQILKQNYTSVQERKAAIHVKDEFENDLRNGMFELAFIQNKSIFIE